VAHYAELRAELLHVERELNLMSRGKLATTRLGTADTIGISPGSLHRRQLRPAGIRDSADAGYGNSRDPDS
jgi:hypothetical protein